MKKIAVILAATLASTALSCQSRPAPAPAPSVDTISAASGQSYYAASSYDADKLAAALKAYPYAGSVTIATVNDDGSPNIAVAVPGLSADGAYLTFGLADNRTKANMIARGMAVVCIYEYAPRAESKADRNKGARIIVV